MGRGRLRRGCSLEVIFEEDPDFCSHLDSLDGGVAIRFGIKEPDETISLDSLLEAEEYQVRFEDRADAEQVFRSLDGIFDVRNMDSCMVEWDEFSMDSDRLGEEDTGNGTATTEKDSLQDDANMEGGLLTSKPEQMERPPSGRRSRVSRRQIIQATWLGYSSSSSDESIANKNDPDDPDTDKNNNTKPQRSRPHKSKPLKEKTKPDNDNDPEPDDPLSLSAADQPTSLNSISSSTSTVKSAGGGNEPLVEPSQNLVTSVEDFPPTPSVASSSNRLRTPIQLHLRSSPNSSPPQHNAIFGRGPLSLTGADYDPFMEKDTLDSYISTMTDETDANAYTFADNFDDTHSVASTSYESSGSTSSTESAGSSVCTVNSFQNNGGRGSKSSSGNEGKTGNSAGFSGISSNTSGAHGGGGVGSKYKTNLKVELVSQLNKETQGRRMIMTGAGSSSPPYSHLSLECPPVKDSVAVVTPPQNNNYRQSGGEVKRVRALFELRSHHSPSSPRSSLNGSGSSSNGSTCPSSPESSSRTKTAKTTPPGETSPAGSTSGRLYSKHGRRNRGSPQMTRGSLTSSPSKVLRTSPTGAAAAPNNQNQDLSEMMVNENVVVEDSPDIYQALRSRRNGSSFDPNSVPSQPICNKRPLTINNLSPGGIAPLRSSTTSSPLRSEGSLRRSQSMGTGISSVGSNSSSVSPVLKESSSKTNILAEELPAPDTVKNVRNVFENMLKMRGKKLSQNHGGSESSVVDAAMNNITPGAFSGSFSIVKKSLSYIKSNPTSKIYRSESMRDDFPSMGGRRYGKPVLLSEQNSPAHSPGYPSVSSTWLGGQAPPSSGSSPSLSSVAETVVDGGGGASVGPRNRRSSSTSPTNKNSETKISPKINTELSPSAVPSMLRSYASSQVPLTEEDPSFSSVVSNTRMMEEDYRTRRYVQSDVLQKIREAGTTTTYFGGKIVAKTVKNRKIPVARRHTFDFQDYVGISGGEILSSQPNYDSYTPTNYNKEGEATDYHHGFSATTPTTACPRDSFNRPPLEIPIKASIASIYSSRPNPTTISSALDSIFSGGAGLLTFASSKPIDTTPRIISVLHKSPPGSQSGSPVKSCSPVGSVLEEGRNSPEGCEASSSTEKIMITMEQDGNNNNLPSMSRKPDPTATGSPRPGCTGESEGFNKKFSQITEGAWF